MERLGEDSKLRVIPTPPVPELDLLDNATRLFESGNFDAALPDLQKLAQKPLTRRESCLLIAKIAWKEGATDAALARYGEYLACDRGNSNRYSLFESTLNRVQDHQRYSSLRELGNTLVPSDSRPELDLRTLITPLRTPNLDPIDYQTLKRHIDRGIQKTSAGIENLCNSGSPLAVEWAVQAIYHFGATPQLLYGLGRAIETSSPHEIVANRAAAVCYELALSTEADPKTIRALALCDFEGKRAPRAELLIQLLQDLNSHPEPALSVRQSVLSLYQNPNQKQHSDSFYQLVTTNQKPSFIADAFEALLVYAPACEQTSRNIISRAREDGILQTSAANGYILRLNDLCSEPVEPGNYWRVPLNGVPIDPHRKRSRG